MFSTSTFTGNFWGQWDSRTRLSPLPPTILGEPATPLEQKLRVQKELVRHCAAWARIWMCWWRNFAPVGETNSESGSESLSLPSPSGAVPHTDANNNHVQLPSPRELIQRICVSPLASGPVPFQGECACGETACDKFPNCISSLADLLSPNPTKRPRVE